MIDATFVEKFEEATRKPRVLRVNGGEIAYVPQGTGWVCDDHEFGVSIPPVTVAPLVFGTLGGLVDYLAANRDEVDLGRSVVHVASPAAVELLGPLQTRWRKRQTYATVALTAQLPQQFPFGRYMPLEEFVVGVLSLFEDDGVGERERLLRLVSSIKGGAESVSQDDGVSQVVIVKRGAHIGGQVVVGNPFQLAPFRTFREVAQPTSRFVLRLSGGTEDTPPQAALFEADGGAWKLQAIERVADWLRAALTEKAAIPVLA